MQSINKIKNNFFVLLFLTFFHAASFDLKANNPSIKIESEIGQQQLGAAVNKAVQTRRLSEIDRLSKERGSLEEDALAHEIVIDATDYTSGETHESSIKNFLEKNFGFLSNNLYCVAPERIAKREFVFIDKENGIVIKVFPQIPKHYFKIIHELSGHEAFSGLHLKTINVVEFLALGKYSLNGIDYILLAMPYAHGQEIRKYIEKIYETHDPILRQEAIDLTKAILRKLGTAVGEIHLNGAIKMTPPEEYMEAIKTNYSNEVQKNLSKYRERGGTHSEELKLHFDKLLAQYNHQGDIFSVFHGDAHLANFLYDKDNDCLTVIDSVKSHLSVDPNGLPISDNFVHDNVKIDDAIAKQILSYEANDELIQELIDAFHQGYDEKAASLIDSLRLDLDKFLQMVKRLASSLKEDKDLSKQESHVRSVDYYEKILIEQFYAD